MKQHKVSTIQQRLKNKLSKDETISIRVTSAELIQLEALAKLSTRAIGKKVSINKLVHTIVEEYLSSPDIQKEISTIKPS